MRNKGDDPPERHPHVCPDTGSAPVVSWAGGNECLETQFKPLFCVLQRTHFTHSQLFAARCADASLFQNDCDDLFLATCFASRFPQCSKISLRIYDNEYLEKEKHELMKLLKITIVVFRTVKESHFLQFRINDRISTIKHFSCSVSKLVYIIHHTAIWMVKTLIYT